MAPRYLDALEAQVGLIRQYHGGGGLINEQLIINAKQIRPKVAKSQLEREIKGQLVDSLKTATTFYLRENALDAIIDIAREYALSLLQRLFPDSLDAEELYRQTGYDNVNADSALRDMVYNVGTEVLDEVEDELAIGWEESVKEISRDFFVFVQGGTTRIYGDEDDEDHSLEFDAILFTHWRDKVTNSYACRMYTFNKDDRGFYLDRIEDYTTAEDGKKYNTRAAISLFSFAADFCNFTQQKIASAFHQPLERGTARRVKRVEISNPDIVVVTLRKTVRRDAREGGIASPVFWTHQWEVDGHIHHYWYGSGDKKYLKPKWVKTYPKGPKNAPLIKKDRIYDVKD